MALLKEKKMTKQKVTEKIIEHIDNCNFMGESEQFKIDGVIVYLDMLDLTTSPATLPDATKERKV